MRYRQRIDIKQAAMFYVLFTGIIMTVAGILWMYTMYSTYKTFDTKNETFIEYVQGGTDTSNIKRVQWKARKDILRAQARTDKLKKEYLK